MILHLRGARKEAGKIPSLSLPCGVDKKTLLKMAGLYAGALIVTLIIKYLFALGFGAGMIVFFAALLAGWKLAYPEIGNSSADNSNNSNDPS